MNAVSLTYVTNLEGRVQLSHMILRAPVGGINVVSRRVPQGERELASNTAWVCMGGKKSLRDDSQKVDLLLLSGNVWTLCLVMTIPTRTFIEKQLTLIKNTIQHLK